MTIAKSSEAQIKKVQEQQRRRKAKLGKEQMLNFYRNVYLNIKACSSNNN